MYSQIVLNVCFITPGKYNSVVEYDGKLVVQKVQTEVRFGVWSFVMEMWAMSPIQWPVKGVCLSFVWPN